MADQSSLQFTIRQLREIIAGMRGVEHESCQLAGQMELLAAEIEKKSGSLIANQAPNAVVNVPIVSQIIS